MKNLVDCQSFIIKTIETDPFYLIVSKESKVTKFFCKRRKAKNHYSK